MILILEITVHLIKGFCPVYKEGDKIIIEDPKILVNKTDAFCTNVLSKILDYTTIIEHNWCPVKLGLTTEKEPDYAFM